MAFILGLTGGIGSGKSAATDIFSRLGIDIVDADVVAREIVKLGSPTLKQIAEHFGQHILLDSGELDRPKLRQLIFSQAEHKQWLEDLLHPAIRQLIIERLQTVSSPYGILVSPLLFETKQQLLVDRTLVIDTPEKIQQERVEKRDPSNRKEIKKIMASQLSRQERNQQADHIINNDNDLEQLSHAIHQYHQQLINELNH